MPNYPTGEWREFTLDTPLELAAETQYAIVFWGPSTDGTNKAYPRCDATASAYPGGYIWGSTDGGASWPNSSPTWDFMFEEWGTADVIPKTSSDSGSGSEVLRSRDLGAAQTGAGTDMARNYSGQKGVAFSIIDLTTFCTPMSWASIDLSAYLPANTTMAFLRVTGGDAAADGFRARKPGGINASIPNTDFPTGSHAWVFAPVVDQAIEVYQEDASVNVFLDGWVTGGDWQGLKTPVTISGLTGDTWNTIRSNAYCPGATAIIFEYDSGAFSWDVRTYGSTWASGHQGGYHHGWGIIGCDSMQRWQLYPNLFGGAIQLSIAVIGYITGDDDGEFLTDPPVITPASQGSYLTKDVSGEFTKGWQMSIVRVHAASSSLKYDFRPVGSSRDWLLAHDNLKWAVVKNTLGSLSFEQYAQHVSQINTLIGGYGLPPKSVGNVAPDLVQGTFI
ncbi:hypothetical protein ES703_95799 [subsurface metagenome]